MEVDGEGERLRASPRGVEVERREKWRERGGGREWGGRERARPGCVSDSLTSLQPSCERGERKKACNPASSGGGVPPDVLPLHVLAAGAIKRTALC